MRALRLPNRAAEWLLAAGLASAAGCGSQELTPLQVDVVGREFYWHFTYPGVDEKLGTSDDFSVAQDLVLPSGRPVVLRVTSDDFIYTFRAPELGLLETAAPGLSFELEFTPDRIGRYRLEVDPMCGFNLLHDNDTMGHVRIDDLNSFEVWFARQALARGRS